MQVAEGAHAWPHVFCNIFLHLACRAKCHVWRHLESSRSSKCRRGFMCLSYIFRDAPEHSFACRPFPRPQLQNPRL